MKAMTNPMTSVPIMPPIQKSIVMLGLAAV